MRVLVCCTESPYPPVAGIKMRGWATICLLRQFADVAVFAVAGRPHPPPGFAPAHWCVAGEPAVLQPAAVWVRSPDGLPSDGAYTERGGSLLRGLLNDFAPDAVVLDALWIYPYLTAIQEYGARIVLNTHNVEADLARQLEAAQTGPGKLQRRIFAERVARREAEVIEQCDQVWACSDQDREQLRREYRKQTPIHVIPNALAPEPYRIAQPRPSAYGESGQPILLFSGAFHYAPNQEAARLLIDELLPQIADSHPGTRLVLAGMNPTDWMREAAVRREDVVVTGFVADMLPYLQHASVMAVPLWMGSGTRFKIVEAFCAGVPVVSSRKGAEGLDVVAERDLLLADEPRGWIAGIRRILDDRDLAAGMAQSASRFAGALWNRTGETIGNALQSLQCTARAEIGALQRRS